MNHQAPTYHQLLSALQQLVYQYPDMVDIGPAKTLLAQYNDSQIPRCACCGTTENLHHDFGSGGPYRCASPNCMVY